MTEKKFKFLKVILESPAVFRESVENVDDKGVEFLVEVVKGLVGDFKILFETVDKLRRIIKGMLALPRNVEASDAFTKNVELICEVLNCDRASIFLHDKLKNTLWSVLAKGSRRIEIPAHSGIAGDVFISGKGANIEDVYLDKRFNKAVDLANNYRSRSMLCVPIFDCDREVIGVCQAINSKHNGFSSDDEHMFSYLAREAGNVLLSSIEYKERDMSFELLKRVLSAGLDLFHVSSQTELLRAVEKNSEMVFGTDCAYVYVVGKEMLYRSVNGALASRAPISGLLGIAVARKEPTDTKHASQHLNYNPLVDINTSGNVRCIPIYIEERKRVTLAIELRNKKGYMHVDKEIIRGFAAYIGAAILALERQGKEFPVIDEAAIPKADLTLSVSSPHH